MQYRLLIDGEMVDGALTLAVINPASEEIVAQCARSDLAQLERAVAAAKAAFPAWSGRSYAERRQVLEDFAAAVEARKDEIAHVLTEENGKPLSDAVHEVIVTVAIIRYFAAREIKLEVVKETADLRVVRQRTALGVVAGIIPWNYPLLLLAVKLAPALIVGNTFIAKAAPTTPLATLLLGEIAAPIFPPGVLSTIVDASDLGHALSTHPDIAKIAFTGSTATGKKVMQSAAGTLKRLTLELGGNDAAIVLDDVDVKAVAAKLFYAATMNAGQLCMATKRIYAPESIYDELCEELGRLAREAVVDDGLKQGTQIGPVQNREQYEKLQDYLADAREHGTIVAGGHPLDRPGFFIAPTVVRDIPDDARVVREEQFGPILPVMSYTTLDDAIARANDSEYGLAGTVWAQDLERGFEVALKVETGTIWINKHMDVHFDVPVGGSKQSGVGEEYGDEGLHEYTQAKIINAAK